MDGVAGGAALAAVLVGAGGRDFHLLPIDVLLLDSYLLALRERVVEVELSVLGLRLLGLRAMKQ